MQRSDIRAVGDLAGEASSVLTTLVRGMHAGISGRVFDSIGPSATPTRTIHDGLTRAIYSGVDRGIRGAAHVAGIVAAEIWGNEADEALESRTDSTAAAIAAVNGIYGDVLTEQREPARRRDDDPVRRQTGSADDRGPRGGIPGGHQPRRRLRARLVPDRAVMVPAAGRGRRRPKLRRNGCATISDTARFFCGTTPDCMCRSMAARSPKFSSCCMTSGQSPSPSSSWSAIRWAVWWRAAHATTGRSMQHGWADAVSRVVCLGSPHLGADLEKGVNIASWALARLPETRAIATFLNARSDGVKDLRFGACLDEDWRDADPDEFLRDRCR